MPNPLDDFEEYMVEPCDTCHARDDCPLPALAQLELMAKFGNDWTGMLEYLLADEQKFIAKYGRPTGLGKHLIAWAREKVSENINVN